MDRARLFRPVTDEAGNLLYGATVTVRTKDFSALISQPIYAGQVGSDTIENPFVAASGYVSLWLDTPERVNLLIEAPGLEETTIILDALPPAPNIVRTENALTITGTAAAGKVLTATSATAANWQTIPTPSGPVPAHNHEGTGTDSVALGDGAAATQASSTAVGDGAQATAAGATAYGKDAEALGAGGTALGNNASAQGADSSAVGQGSVASAGFATAVGAVAVASGTQATALGHGAQALGDNTLAVGDSSSASADGATALGATAQASAADALALGSAATASHARSVALGPGATTSAADQVVLGTSGHTVLATGEVRAQDDVALGSPTSALGFFGATPVPVQTVTGSDGGDLVLRAAIEALADLGLILDTTTKP